VPPITKQQIRRLQALGAGAGLKSGHPDDDYHAVISRLTGKASTTALTAAEFAAVERELLNYMRQGVRQLKPKPKPAARAASAPGAGMMTTAQQSKAWQYIYRLIELDRDAKRATAGERMTGAIRKVLGVDADVKDPFRWVTQADGRKLIDMLKRYVYTAEKAGLGG
jgi:hypothetical protein